MFVAFFPQEGERGMSAEAFVSSFRIARIVFRVYAPLVAFVWVPPNGETHVTPEHPFYPGHDAVDWVGLPALALRSEVGTPPDLMEGIIPFHQNFAPFKPIMLLPLGISHFSRAGYVYYMEETAAEIEGIYSALQGLPRVRAVVWRNTLRYGPEWDALSVTRECEIREAYTRAVGDPYYLSGIRNAPQSQQWLRSEFEGFYYDGMYYVDMQTLAAELSHTHRGETVEMDGRRFVPVTQLSIPATICRTTNIIRLILPT
jgi:hypothetical protein